jgi:hypothetical protein
MNQYQLNDYFGNIWIPNVDKYKYSGWTLIDKVLDEEFVLDVGCGENPFKNKIKNLIGIDPAFDQADYKVTIEDFETDQKFDVAFCLGSINFGSKNQIISQIQLIVNILNPTSRIYWRCNPGIFDHKNEECKKINFYPWTIEDHFELSEYFGFECGEIKIDTDSRIYAEWERS